MNHQLISYTFSKYLTGILLFSICTVICHGQDNSFKFRRLTIEDGLSQSSVHSIAQDKEGYIWLATANGLNRFDGYEFKIFKKEIDSDSSLSNNRTEKIFIDSRNRLWVGTIGGGLNLFNDETGSFISIPLSPEKTLGIKAIYESPDGELWIGARNGSLFQIESHKKDSVSVISHPVIINETRVDHEINDIIFFRDKLLLGTSGRGVIYFDPESETFSEFHHSSHNDLLSNCFVNSFYIDKENRLWIATDDVGMFVLDDNGERITHVDFEKYGAKGLLANNIYSLTEDRLGYLWVATKGGLNVSKKRIRDYENFDSLSFTRHIFSPSDQNSLSNNFVLSIFEDRSGLMWVGTSADGVNLFYRSSELFNYFQKIEGLPNSLENETIMSVYDDDNEVLWIGSDGGLIKFDKNKKTFEDYWNEVGDRSFQFNTIMSITELEPGKLLLGTYGGGLVIFDQLKEQYTTLVNDNYTALDLNERVLTTYKDRHGNIWVGTDGDGILKFRYNKNIQEITFEQYRPIPDDSSSLSHDDVWKFFEDAEGTFWIGTAGGLNRYHPEEEKFTRYRHIPNNRESLSSNRVYSIHNLDSNSLLIGTDNGLNIFDKTTGTFEYFTEKDGLPNHVIYGVLQESDNYFWLSTNNGISRFDSNTKTFKNYSTTDGIPSNEFNTGAYFKNSKGELFFGSTKGLLWFDPSRLETLTNRFIPSVVISEIEVKGRENSSYLNPSEILQLKHNQNTLTLSFAALDFSSPSRNQYAYKLDEIDSDWTYIGNRRFVTFSNLDPGSYNFLVKGSNSDAVWNETPASLRFTISPPWWKSRLAWFLFVCLAGALAWWFYRFQLSRQLAVAESARLREIDQLKTNLYTNITHEFRTPLTVILGMADALKHRKKNSEENAGVQSDRNGEPLEMIQRNGKKLLKLVNEMLDLAKLEQGQMQPDYVKSDVVSFVKYISKSYLSLAEKSGIHLTLYSEIDSLVMDFDPDKLSVIVSNLLSNALKFTPRDGKIIVHLNRVVDPEDEYFVFKVKDTGAGIPQSSLPRIFDRFYQADAPSSRNGYGTGVGLALTKELAELMEGTIEVKSTVGKGSEFTVRLPARRNAREVEAIVHSSRVDIEISSDMKPALIPTEEADKDLPLVLIIEDNRDVAAYLRMSLEEKYRVLHSGNGKDGLDVAYRTIPDVVICDVMMPGMDGYEVCSLLKSDNRTDHIPVIMLTAKATEADRLTGLTKGADAYLTKPFNKAELFTRLDQLILLRRKLTRKFEDEGWGQLLQHRPKDPETKFIREAVRIIHEELGNEAFRSAHLARKLHLSESQLYRKLKAISGKSTAIFIRSVRLQHARQMILTTDQNISEIAYHTGFSEPSWFSRAFKEEFGYAPSEVRK